MEGGGANLNSSLPLCFMGTYTLAGQLLLGAHLCAWLEAGLKPGTFGFRAQIANRQGTHPERNLLYQGN